MHATASPHLLTAHARRRLHPRHTDCEDAKHLLQELLNPRRLQGKDLRRHVLWPYLSYGMVGKINTQVRKRGSDD